MQPTLVLAAPNPGIVYLNGQFAGELGPQQPLLRPAAPRGALYIDYRPLNDLCRPLARRLVFSGGEILAESAESADKLNIILWPEGVSEVEIAPDPWQLPRSSFRHGGFLFELEGGAQPRLLCDGRLLGSLPEGAQPPAVHSLPGGEALLGSCAGGMYLLTADRDFRSQTGFLRAQRIEIDPDGSIRALLPAPDPVGHAVRESWQLSEAGLRLLSSQPSFLEGVPQWPQSAEGAAIAAVEAARAGRMEEAENYLAPRLRQQHPLEAIVALCDLCVAMKYAPPHSRPAVGLLRLQSDSFARVRPLFFRASPSGQRQGPWQIDELEWE